MTETEYLIQKIDTFLKSHESRYWVLELDKDELQVIIKALKGEELETSERIKTKPKINH